MSIHRPDAHVARPAAYMRVPGRFVVYLRLMCTDREQDQLNQQSLLEYGHPTTRDATRSDSVDVYNTACRNCAALA